MGGKNTTAVGVDADAERLCRQLLDSMPDCVLIVSPRGDILEANSVMCERSRYSRSELLSMNIADVRPPEYAGLVPSRLESVSRDGRRVFDAAILCRDGTTIPVEVTASPITYRGQPAQIGVAHDIGDRKRAERWYAGTLDAMDDAIHVVDRDLRFVLFNTRFKEWNRRFGLDTDVVGRRLSDVFPFLPAAVAEQYRRVFADGKALHTDETTCVSGQDVTTETWKIPIVEDGKTVRVVTVIRDITERRLTERQLRESEARYRCMVEAVPIITFHSDAKGGLIAANRRWYTCTGQTAEEARGSGWMSALHPEDRGRVAREILDAVGARDVREMEMRLRQGSTGQYRWHLMGAVPVRDEAGAVVEWFAAAADIHTQKCAAETLEREVAKRTTALRERSRQLAQVAAELTLAEQRERRRIAEILHDHLQQVLVGARMKIYNLTSRAGEPYKGELADLHAILTEALNTAQGITKELAPPLLPQMELTAMLQWLAREMERRHALLVEIRAEPMPDTDVPEAASVLLQTTARELLLNVVKHSGTRRAVVVCRRQGDAVVLEVRDQGCGFDPTVMLSPGDARGFGLLSIRERAELLGGRLTVDAAPGRGVQAVLTLPLAQPRPARRRPGGRAGDRGKARRRISENRSSAW